MLWVLDQSSTIDYVYINGIFYKNEHSLYLECRRTSITREIHVFILYVCSTLRKLRDAIFKSK
jgi:hypothetical protein